MSDNSVTIRGVDGKFYWGYLLAGTVRAWTVTRSGAGDPGTLTATVVSLNTVRASQHPIVFVVQHKHGEWRWPLTGLQISGDALTATLSPVESVNEQQSPAS